MKPPRDYLTSVSGLSGWNDGNPVITNYVGHPMMGAITGFIQVQNDPRGITLEWNARNPKYWKSRFKALGWATLYSTSYERSLANLLRFDDRAHRDTREIGGATDPADYVPYAPTPHDDR